MSTGHHGAGGTVMAVDKAGGEPGIIASEQVNPCGIAVDAGTLVWTSRESGAVRMVPKTGGPVRELATGLVSPERIAVDGTHLYWIDHGGPGEAPHDRRMMRLPK